LSYSAFIRVHLSLLALVVLLVINTVAEIVENKDKK
jgi:hypothetical protein